MDSDKRKARIRRLKKEIPIAILVLITVPWIFVIVLSVRKTGIEKELKDANNLANQYLAEIEMLTAAEPDEEPVTEEVMESVPEVTGPRYNVEEMTPEEIASLELSDEELYDGYRKVYLTFDDGPSAFTEDILDILKEYDVKATFFVIYKEGREYEELYRRIVDEGHTLGMHSCTHVYSTVYGSEESFKEDTEKLRNFLYMVTGVESQFYRFPGGSSNRVSRIDMKKFAGILNDEGIIYYDWNVSSQDATTPALSKDKIVWYTTQGIKNKEEAVVLMHDTGAKWSTVQALPEIIEYIQSLDNTVILPISRETNPIHHVSVDK